MAASAASRRSSAESAEAMELARLPPLPEGFEFSDFLWKGGMTANLYFVRKSGTKRPVPTHEAARQLIIAANLAAANGTSLEEAIPHFVWEQKRMREAGVSPPIYKPAVGEYVELPAHMVGGTPRSTTGSPLAGAGATTSFDFDAKLADIKEHIDNMHRHILKVMALYHRACTEDATEDDVEAARAEIEEALGEDAGAGAGAGATVVRRKVAGR